MSDFANYIRVAIQGLPENTPLARASAYEKVRKVIKRQLESRSADSAEVESTMEELENAILDLEAEQLMVPTMSPAKPTPAPAKPREPAAPVFEADSNVTPIVRKSAEQTPKEPAPIAKPADRQPSVAPAATERYVASPRESQDTKVVARAPEIAPEAPAPIVTPAAQSPSPSAAPTASFLAPRHASLGATSGQALKLEAPSRDPLEEFQAALTAELALPITAEEQRKTRPAAQAAESAGEDGQGEANSDTIEMPPVGEPLVPELPVAAPGEASFDVRDLLRKAVGSEDMRDSATREIIYRRARNALVRYLKSLSPQPDFDTVHGHIERLNAAIREVEAEQGKKSYGLDSADTGTGGGLMTELQDIWSSDFDPLTADEPVVVHAKPVKRAAPEPVAPPPEPKRPEPKSVERTISDEVEEALKDLANSDIGREAETIEFEDDTPPARSIDEEVEQAFQEMIAADTSRRKPARDEYADPDAGQPRARPAPVPVPQDVFFEEEEPVRPQPASRKKPVEEENWSLDESFDLPEDLFDDDFAEEEPPAPVAAAPAAASRRKAPRTNGRPKQRRRSGGRFIAILLVLLVAGVIAVAVAFPNMVPRYVARAGDAGTWAFELIAGLAGEPTRTTPDTSDAPPAAASADAPAQQPAGGSTAPSAEPARLSDASAPSTSRISGAAPAQDAAPRQPAPQPAATPATGERAVLFPSDGNPQGGEIGNVSWSLISSAPQPNAPVEPAIRADVAVPSQGLRATLTLRRNLDETLPATHLFELVFAPSQSVAGTGIASVEGITVKPASSDTSAPLVGSVVKIADNIFLFALADIPAARTAHNSLFRDPEAIDIQFVYYSGRRSTLRLVSGEPGRKAFQTAAAAWSGGATETASAPSRPEQVSEPAVTQPAAASEPSPVPAPAPEPASAPAAAQTETAESAATTADGASETPARPLIPEIVPIPSDRPLFDG